MDSPNSSANMIGASSDRSGTSFGTPISDLPQPNVNTMTITPYVARIVSRFIAEAFNGTRIDRKTVVRMISAIRMTSPMKAGNRSAMR